jgi:phosphate transport system permease protein
MGLFIYTIWVLRYGLSGLAGALALACLMLPIVVRTSEEMLRLVPNELREAAFALGVPKWLTIVKVVLRTAVAGLTTGVLLAVARVIGETAPILITAGTADSINLNPFDGRMMTLPVFIFSQYRQGTVPCREGAVDCVADINYLRAWAAALTLIVIVMLLNLLGRLVTRWFAPRLR